MENLRPENGNKLVLKELEVLVADFERLSRDFGSEDRDLHDKAWSIFYHMPVGKWHSIRAYYKREENAEMIARWEEIDSAL